MRWKDSKNLVSKANKGKLVNTWKLLSSYYKSRIRGIPSIEGMPNSISIEPTTSCNLRCPECPSGLRAFSRPTGMMGFDLFEKVVDELSPTLMYMTLYFQGEPYLNPEFQKMIAYASSRGIYTSTSTNAHYLSEEHCLETIVSGLDRIIISIDGADQESYAKYRIGGDIEKVISGTKRLVAWKKKLGSQTPHIIFQFIAFNHNEHQIREVRKLGHEIGVDEVLIKTAQVYDYENGNPLIPENPKLARYGKKPEGKWHIKGQLLDHCWRMWQGSVITWDGRVLPCCFDKDGKYQLGDLHQQSFSSVWRSDAYNDFRASILKSRKSIDICTNCTEGSNVWA